MMTFKVEQEIGGRLMSIETGKVAKQADAAVVVRHGDTVVLVTVVRAKPREGIDFFPLTVDYREKTYAAGKFPGGFYKREGRPTNKEILTMRLIDRPARPLFPARFMDEVQIQSFVLSADQENEPDVLAVVGAGAVLSLSSIPFDGPIGAVRVGRVEGQFVINPTQAELECSDLDLVVAGHTDGVNMIECGSRELPEEVVAAGIAFGHRGVVQICQMITELAGKCGKEKTWEPPEDPAGLAEKVRGLAAAEMETRRQIAGKLERKKAIDELYEQVTEQLSPADAETPEYTQAQVFAALQELEGQIVRRMVLDSGIRSDGRGPDDIRPITCEVCVLPRTHGSAIFTRGETQALAVTTLGTVGDEQKIDGLGAEYTRKFMLHYNFPPFCVGEARRIFGPGRREIGHGALAERSLEAVLPSPDEFPYTIRVVADILESNGSSSMASVCGGTLSLMDAGIPISQPVAGISIGLIKDPDRSMLLTDIIGEEDHFGEMDFKVAGTQRGVTGIQLDLKARMISQDVIVKALHRAKDARMHILREMLRTLSRPRPKISDYAPRILKMQINPEKIGKLIGPGGRGVRKIEMDTGAKIEIEDDGTVYISCLNVEGAEAARQMVEMVTEEVRVGKVYDGRVSSIKDFGAFIEIVPGQDGLCHISELADGYIRSVTDVCKVGDPLRVKVIAIDDQGRLKLSRRAVIREEGGDGSPSQD